MKNSVQELELGAIQGYITVECNGKWWVAYVDELRPGTHEVSVNFLHPHGPSPSNIFPEPQDTLVVDISDVLIQISPSTATGRTYTLQRMTRTELRLHLKRDLKKLCK